MSLSVSPNIGDHHCLHQHHLTYWNLATKRQQRAYRLVREQHAVTASRLARRNNPVMNAQRLSPPYTVGGLAWVYNSAATIHQGTNKDTDTTMLKTTLSLK